MILGALISIALIAGVAWYGERTHFHATRPPPPGPTPKVPPFTVEPDPPVRVDVEDARPVPHDEVAAPPMQPDVPQAAAQPNDITVPLEPPPLVANASDMAKIPPGRSGDNAAIHAFDPGQLEQQPVVKYRDSPVYPQGMREKGMTGEVLVDFIVDPSGSVRNPVAARSTNREFEEPACRAVGRWKFTPGRKGGHAVYVHMQVPVVFTLNSDAGR
jgi:protein TonB